MPPELSDTRLKDKDWRMNHLYKIKNKKQQLVTFTYNPPQKDFQLRKHTRNIILKSRQLGFTTFEAVDQLDEALFVPNTDCLMLSYDAQSQLDIFDNKINFSWETFPEELQELYKLDADRANKLKFNWGDGSTSSVSVKTQGRSGTFSRLHVSELAKTCKQDPKKAAELVRGTIPTVPITGRIDIESTAEDDWGAFYEMFWTAWNRGEPTSPYEFKAFFYNWTWDKEELEQTKVIARELLPYEFIEYQKEHNLSDIEISYYYNKWVMLNNSWDDLHREYPTTPEEAFLSAGKKFFNMESVSRLKVVEPIAENGSWKYFANYIPGHRYALAADPAGGFGGDNAAIVVIDFSAKDENGYEKPAVVAVYANNRIAPDLLAYEIISGARAYGNCIVAVESNNHGHATIAILKQSYFNLFKKMRTKDFNDTPTEEIGWQTNGATKPKMMYELSTAINESLLNVPDKGLIRELQTYPQEDLSSISRDPDIKHWDLTMALAICWQMKISAGPTNITMSSEGEDSFDKFAVVGRI